MRTSLKTLVRVTTLLIATLVPGLTVTGAIVTNWVAYNDHSPNTNAVNGWVTAQKVTTYDMGETGGGGNLTNFLNGQQLPVTMASMHTGTAHGFGLAVEPNDGTPAALLFKGKVDVSNPPNNQPGGNLIGTQFSQNDSATFTLSG